MKAEFAFASENLVAAGMLRDVSLAMRKVRACAQMKGTKIVECAPNIMEVANIYILGTRTNGETSQQQ